MTQIAKTASLQVIVAVDDFFGIGRDNTIPWNHPEDLAQFNLETSRGYKPMIIVGAKTAETLPKVVFDRGVIVVGSAPDQTPSFERAVSDAIKLGCDNITAAGGRNIYEAAVAHSLCSVVRATMIPGSYSCTTFVGPRLRALLGRGFVKNWSKRKLTNDTPLTVLVRLRKTKDEDAFHLLLRDTLMAPLGINRTATGTRSIFGAHLKYDLTDEFGRLIVPMCTSKRMPFRVVFAELLWMLRGHTNTSELHKHNVHIWDGNASREFLDSRGLIDYPEGELGPVYGAQWRAFNGDVNCDQIANVIRDIRRDPTSRRHVVSAWNPLQTDKMALPPCHFAMVFVVLDNRLNLQVTMRSNDLFLGHPFNAVGYALLTHMIASLCGLMPGELAFALANAHVYNNHFDAASIQLKRRTFGRPTITFTRDHTEIDDFDESSIELGDYVCGDAIKAPMVV